MATMDPVARIATFQEEQVVRAGALLLEEVGHAMHHEQVWAQMMQDCMRSAHKRCHGPWHS